MKLSAKLWCLIGVHEYKVMSSGEVIYIGLDGRPDGTSGTYFVNRCEICGKIKEWRV
ncbi:hypothetical protein Q040_02686 [Pseudomonas aeruginosa BWHPSA027]|nr:hypothetical protein Q040_02686 [Pseudomonas aeruginosa BWHPSA027]